MIELSSGKRSSDVGRSPMLYYIYPRLNMPLISVHTHTRFMDWAQFLLLVSEYLILHVPVLLDVENATSAGY